MVSQAQSPIRGVRQSLRAVRHSLRSSSNRLRRSTRGPEGVAAILEEREWDPPHPASQTRKPSLCNSCMGSPQRGGGGQEVGDWCASYRCCMFCCRARAARLTAVSACNRNGC